MNPPFPCSPKPLHVGVPQILVPIILIGTVTIQACMGFFLRLTPFWSIIIDTYISADFSSGNIIGVT